MAQVFKVSKPGQDVTVGTVPNNFYLDTNYPLLKVHSSGTFNTNVALFPLTVNHNLGYYPFVLVFSQFLDSNGGTPVVSTEYYQHDWVLRGVSAEWIGQTRIFTDKIQINVAQTDIASGTSIKGFYYIFKDPIV